ncbi:hypothetical protein JHK86_000827 [Glycine max]|nr:hypothetical protein JHK86_000827 [Glycine max]
MIIEAPEVTESTSAPTIEKPKEKDDEALEPTSNEATWKNIIDVIVHTTTFEPTPINFAPPKVVTKTEVKEMIGLAMDKFAKKKMAENEEFRCTMQQAIATQFSSLGGSLILNLQQAQMRLFNVVVAAPMPLPPIQLQPPSFLKHFHPTHSDIPPPPNHPPPSQPSPPPLRISNNVLHHFFHL